MAVPKDAPDRAAARRLLAPAFAVFSAAVAQREIQLPDGFIGGADDICLMPAEIVGRVFHVFARISQCLDRPGNARMHGAFILCRERPGAEDRVAELERAMEADKKGLPA